jgi:type VI secretion system protein ImpL
MTHQIAVIGIQALIPCVAIAVLIWRQKKTQYGSDPDEPVLTPRPSSGGVGSRVQALFHEAESKLKVSAAMQGASLSTLPVILVVGPTGAGKTSVVLQSGLNPELLAGDAYRGSDVLPTRGLNIWLAGESIFIEISAAVAADVSTIKTVLKHLVPGQISSGFQPSQAPRGILLCVDQSAIASAVAAAEVVALARPWSDLISLAAETLGVPAPAYVLFTKTNAVSGFQEFFSNLSGKDPGQPVGATVRPFRASLGANARDASRLLTQHFLDIVHCLSDARLPLLNREPDEERAARGYQFPREFNKLQKNVVQFLVEVARPRKLLANSFLRGFYFCGTGKVTVEPAGHAGAAAPIPAEMGISATRVMTGAEFAAFKAGPVPVERREITQWLFLTALFDSIMLRDCRAHQVNTGSLRTDRIRAAGLAIAATLGIVLLVGVTVSFARNRALEKDLISAEKALADSGSPVDIISRLDKMRRPVEQLIEYRSGAPLSMRWGFYRGEDLLIPAQTGYCAAIRTQVLPPLLQTMSSRLRAMPGGGADGSGGFGNLKAYMMLTTHPQKVEETFLTRKLFGVWSEASGRTAPLEVKQALPAELQLYAALLSNPEAQKYCVNPASAGVIPVAQGYLRAFSANERYQSLLQAAGGDLKPVNYGALFPNDAVGDPKIVPGWFTHPGWTKMQELLDHPADSLSTDAWVLGESKELTSQELSSLAAEFKTRYADDYAKAWKDFLDSARVTPYANLNDAASKLEKIAGQNAELLNLIGLVAKHAASIDKFQTVFQPVSVVVPAEGDFQTGAGAYVNQLNSLKNRLSKAALSTGPAREQDIAEVRKAAAMVKDTVDKMTVKTFKGETSQMVKATLLKPIIQINPLLDRDAAGDINAGGRELCNTYGRLAGLLPFSRSAQQGASTEDIQRVFQPETGQMWRFYNKSLKDSLECSDATCYSKANPGVQLSKGFIEYFRGLNRWSRLLYGGNLEPIVRLQVRATAVNRLKQLEMVIGDSRVTLPAGGSEFQPISWDPRRNQKLQVIGTFEGEPEGQDLYRGEGSWALFEWFNDIEANSGGADGFTWIPRSGRVNPALLQNGNTKKYKLEIRSGDGAARAFDLRQLAVGPCVLPSVK